MITEDYKFSKDNKDKSCEEFAYSGEDSSDIPETMTKEIIEENKTYSSDNAQYSNNIPEKPPNIDIIIEFLEESLKQSKKSLKKELKKYYKLIKEENVVNYIRHKGITTNIFEGVKNKADEILTNPVYIIEYIKNHEYPDESKIMIKIYADIQQSECFTKMDEIYDFLYDNYKEKLISSISVFVVKK
jgi:hypothetical protein